MREIQLSEDQYDKLMQHAVAAGYADVSAFLGALAHEPHIDPRGELSDQELRESAAECDGALEELKSNGGRDLREGLLEIGSKRGYSSSE